MKAASFGCRKPLSNGVKNRIVAEPEMEHACNTLQKTDHNQSLSVHMQIQYPLALVSAAHPWGAKGYRLAIILGQMWRSGADSG